ncbi:MAG: tetratricopeptide repeat protein [Methylococcales bacterium]
MSRTKYSFPNDSLSDKDTAKHSEWIFDHCEVKMWEGVDHILDATRLSKWQLYERVVDSIMALNRIILTRSATVPLSGAERQKMLDRMGRRVKILGLLDDERGTELLIRVLADAASDFKVSRDLSCLVLLNTTADALVNIGTPALPYFNKWLDNQTTKPAVHASLEAVSHRINGFHGAPKISYQPNARSATIIGRIRYELALRRFIVASKRLSIIETVEQLEVLADLAKRLCGERDPLTIDCLRYLGVFYRENGDPKAEQIFERALAFARQEQGSFGELASKLLTNLAAMCKLLDNFDKAESCYREAYAIDRLILGEEHPDTITDMHNLADLLWNRHKMRESPWLRYQRGGTKADDNNEARELFARVRLIDRKYWGPNHERIAEDRMAYSDILIADGFWNEAERELRAALRTYETGYPHLTIKTGQAIDRLASVLESQGKWSDGELVALRKRVLDIDQQVRPLSYGFRSRLLRSWARPCPR